MWVKLPVCQALVSKAEQEVATLSDGPPPSKKTKGEVVTIEQVFQRFPEVGEQILEHLDDQSLTNCRQVNRFWLNFVDSRKLFYWRKIQGFSYISHKSARKTLCKRTIEELREVEKFSRENLKGTCGK